MRVLVTGANGLLGQKLVALLCNHEQAELFATGRGVNRNPLKSGYTYESADLVDREVVSRLIQKVNPDVVIHGAAMTQVDECELNPEACMQANVSATQNLVDAAKEVGAYFQLVSTDFVFDGKAGPYDEAASPNPVSHYGQCKLEAENLVKASDLKWSIVRTVLVYGRSYDPSRSNIVLWVQKNLVEGKKIKVVNDQWRTPTLAEDLALGCWLVVKNWHQGIFHISGEETLTPYEIALRVAEHLSLDSRLVTPVDASTFTQPGKRPPRTGFVINKARRVLGFQPRSFDEGLQVVLGS